MLCPCSAHPCFQGPPRGPGHHSAPSDGVLPAPLPRVPASAPSQQPEGLCLAHSCPPRMPCGPSVHSPPGLHLCSLHITHRSHWSLHLQPLLSDIWVTPCGLQGLTQMPAQIPNCFCILLPAPCPRAPPLPTPTSTDTLGSRTALRSRIYLCGSCLSPVLHRQKDMDPASLLLAPGTQPGKASVKADGADEAGPARPRLPVVRAWAGRHQAEPREKLLEKRFPAAQTLPLG